MSTCDISNYEWIISVIEHFMTKFDELPEQPSYHPKIGVCESILTYEQKASIPLIAMMYILHRQLNEKFLPLADF